MWLERGLRSCASAWCVSPAASTYVWVRRMRQPRAASAFQCVLLEVGIVGVQGMSPGTISVQMWDAWEVDARGTVGWGLVSMRVGLSLQACGRMRTRSCLLLSNGCHPAGPAQPPPSFIFLSFLSPFRLGASRGWTQPPRPTRHLLQITKPWESACL